MSHDVWSTVESWLESRLETAPAELAGAVRALVAEVREEAAVSWDDRADGSTSVAEVLVAASLRGFDGVVTDPRPEANVRGAALRLLAADAALTYAFEVASEGDVEDSLALALRTGVAGSLGDRLAATRVDVAGETSGAVS